MSSFDIVWQYLVWSEDKTVTVTVGDKSLKNYSTGSSQVFNAKLLCINYLYVKYDMENFFLSRIKETPQFCSSVEKLLCLALTVNIQA